MDHILIDFEKTVGMVKPMHAVNNVQSLPYDFYGGLDRMSEAYIPYARLHDTGGPYGGGCYVDIANVFPNFDADETDPASYDFAFTDVLLSGMAEKGIKPFYRLGATIENYHKIKAYNIYPPKDFEKWARICEHIILHYNEGWANGFHMDLDYWEIWNEPDNEPEIADNPCWKGTKEQFFELYDVTSKHLKKKFPHLKIGGYASCGFYALTNTFIKAANSSPRKEYFLEFFEEFLAYAKEHGSVMDFFSWHSYADVKRNVIYANYAKERLSAYGFGDCEVFLNEWNPSKGTRGNKRGDPADVLAMMIALHGTPTDMCMYYDAAERSGYCGIFNPYTHGVTGTYYAFYYFGQLYHLGEKCLSEADGEDLYVMAAKGEGKRAFVLVNDKDEEREVFLSVKGADLQTGTVKATDLGKECYETKALTERVVLPPYGIRYVEFEQSLNK
ncbi:MAG: hypothetical protein IKA76_07855 [Clostridia bacterium]|nr:hypothetical protein [Clostridia bacterium]